jgi:O-antigen/teichoic acid export membrane protein
MTKTKISFLNSLTAALYSIVQIAVGIILPRLILGKFGSDINGLTVSIQQYIGYLTYLEIGLSSVFIYSLYKPLAANDYSNINNLVISAKKSYDKTGLFYFIGIVVVAVIYPFLVNTGGIELWIVILLVFVIGISGLFDMITVSKYRVLLTADQKLYIINLSFSASALVGFIFSFLLIYFNQHILAVKASVIISIILRTIFLHFYVKKKYPYLNFKKTEEIVAPKVQVKRFDALLMQLSKSIAHSLPIIALSLFTSLKVVSIYSVYALVFHGLKTIVDSVTGGSTASFGNLFSNKEEKKAVIAFGQFELSLASIQTLLYSVASILIIPFVTLYVRGIEDASNYINPLFGILFVFWAFIDNFRLPAQTIIQAAGKFKETRITNILYIVIEIILLSVLTPFFGIAGALISMIVASLYKSISFLVIVKKYIFRDYYIPSIVRAMVGLFLLVSAQLFAHYIGIKVDGIMSFVFWGTLLVLLFAVIIVALSFVHSKKDTRSLLRRFFIRKKR